MDIERYTLSRKDLWDKFVSQSKNGNFLFLRDYMEYHSDRFRDYSLMVFDNDCLRAIFPATVIDKTIISHGGLTFGGFITDKHMKVHLMLDILEKVKQYFRSLGLARIIYKAIPHIYHAIPAEEDLYALFRAEAKLFRRDISSCINLAERISFSKGRKACVSKAKQQGVEVQRSDDFEQFMGIETEHLRKKHGVDPVHSTAEITYLANLFPNQIKLFSACCKEAMLGGVIVYESKQVAHAQYIAATEAGKSIGCLDAVLNFLINDYYCQSSSIKYFDFGISTNHQGQFLDIDLIRNKESFGARAVAYDFYEISLTG